MLPYDKKRNFQVPTIPWNKIILCNVQEFWDSKVCPRCSQLTKRQSVRIRDFFGTRFLYANNVYCCAKCDVFYISRESLDKLNKKAEEKFKTSIYMSLANIYVERVEGKYLYIPKKEFKTKAPYYDVRYGGLYIPTPDERHYTNTYDDLDEYKIPLREKSILGELGYSVDLPDTYRKKVLENAVEKYGQHCVIVAINRNIHLREKQKKDYSRAIRVWKNDIEFVKTIDETAYLQRIEMERKKREEEIEAEEERRRMERLEYYHSKHDISEIDMSKWTREQRKEREEYLKVFWWEK